MVMNGAVEGLLKRQGKPDVAVACLHAADSCKVVVAITGESASGCSLRVCYVLIDMATCCNVQVSSPRMWTYW